MTSIYKTFTGYIDLDKLVSISNASLTMYKKAAFEMHFQLMDQPVRYEREPDYYIDGETDDQRLNNLQNDIDKIVLEWEKWKIYKYYYKIPS